MPADPRGLVAAIRSGDEGEVRRALRREPEAARHPRIACAAAQAGRPGILGAVLSAGADPNASWRGYRPLHALIQERPHGSAGDLPDERMDCLALLVEAGADPERLGAYPPARALLVAAFTGAPAAVRALVDAGARVDVFVDAALGRAARVRAALGREPSLAVARDDGGLTALQCAAASRMGRASSRARRGIADCARALLDAGADPNARTRAWSHDVDTASFAASDDAAEVFLLLLERGADATSALAPALWNGAEALATEALARGAAPDRARSNGLPLLNDLVRWGQVRAALWLVERGASPNVADERAGRTALHQAASRGNPRLFEALLAAGGDPARRDAAGRTPVAIASARGHRRIVEVRAATGRRAGPG